MARACIRCLLFTVFATVVAVADAPLAARGGATPLQSPNREPIAEHSWLGVRMGGSRQGRMIATDPDGDALTFTVVTPPTGGTVTITDASTGEFTYTPVVGFGNADSFTFRAGDGQLTSNLGTVRIEVSVPEIEVVQAFRYGPEGSHPRRIVRGGDGTLYGTTVFGGFGFGTVFKLNSDGTLVTLHPFLSSDGAHPYGGVVFGQDGELYGTTSSGGAFQKGTVFRLSLGGALTTVHTFNGSNGSNPEGCLSLGPDGSLYGTTVSGGSSNLGTIFKVLPGGEVVTLHTFTRVDGANPHGRLAIDSEGTVFGTTRSGGAFSQGTLFRLSTAGSFETLHAFDGPGGSQPYGGVALGMNGTLYGTTYWGGAYNQGTVFARAPDGVFTTLHSFSQTDGANPYSEPTLDSAGYLYGTTVNGGPPNLGTVFRIAPNGSLTTLHTFAFSSGGNPYAPVVLEDDGGIHGTATIHGPASLGVVFRVTVTGTYETSFAFGRYGALPLAGVAAGMDGGLYGTTASGGTFNRGTVYRVSADGSAKILHSFDGPTGASPSSRVTVASDGNIYGTTSSGGASNLGTLFRLTPTGSLATLHSFDNVTGANPQAGVVEGPDGALYGTTSLGGTWNRGTVFRLSPNGVLATLHAFDGTNGASPISDLTVGPDGNVYGTASAGTSIGGTLFRIDANGAFSVLHTFGGASGSSPRTILLSSDGSLHGITASGGTFGYGTVFRLTAAGSFETLHSFSGGLDGQSPSDLIRGSDAALYVSLGSGGYSNRGTIARLTSTGSSTIFRFRGSDGYQPLGIRQIGNDLVGTTIGITTSGGATGYGAVFRLFVPSLNAVPVAENLAVTAAAGATISDVLVAADPHGDALTYSVIANGTQGTATVTNPETGAFTYQANADASGTDSFTYQASDGVNVSNIGTVTVTFLTAPVITWAQPSPMPVGAPLGAGQLNAAANVPGAFTYNPPAGTVLPVGRNTVTVTFAPDQAAYSTATASVEIDVLRQLPTVRFGGGGMTPTGPMAAARRSHAAVLLRDGQVLVAGSDSFLTSAELFDPYREAFSATGSMTTGRCYGCGTVRLQDGRVLLAGGWTGGGGVLRSAELYDPLVGAFAPTVGLLGEGRLGPSATLLQDGRVLIAGGHDGSAPYATAEVFDPEMGTFAPTGSMGVRRLTPSAPLPDGRVLFAGGQSSGGVYLASAELYIPSSGTFISTGGMSVARHGHTVTPLADGRVLVTGGLGVGNAVLASAEIFDPEAGTFAAVGSMSRPRSGHAAVALRDGRVLIVGGASAPGTTLASVEEFDPATATFRPAPSLAAPRADASATLLLDGSVLIAGGTNASGLRVQTGERYRPWGGRLPSITHGTPLGHAQLSATADVPGSVSYSPPAGTVLDAGVHTLVATFTPTDSANYATVTATAELEVLPGVSLLFDTAVGVPGGTTTLVAVLRRSDGGDVSGRSVIFSVGRDTVGTAETDAAGVARLSGVPVPSDLTPGGIPTTANFQGDALLIGVIAQSQLVPGRDASSFTWTQLLPENAPSPRHGHRMVFDPDRSKVILFGGRDPQGAYLNDLWEFDLASKTWSVVTPTTTDLPIPRAYFGMAYDEARRKVVVYGGAVSTQYSNVGTNGNTWEYDPTTQAWSTNPSANTLVHIGLVGSVMAFDPVTQQVILFGGRPYWAYPYESRTWGWNGSDWQLLASTGPIGRYGHAMATDSVRNRVLLYGGQSRDNTGAGQNDNDVWEWDGLAWYQLAANGSGPASGQDATLGFDALQSKMVLTTNDSPRQTWEWNGAAWSLRTTSGVATAGAAAMAATPEGLVLVPGGGATTVETWLGAPRFGAESVLTMPDVTAPYNGTVQVSATLTANGEPVIGRSIVFALGSQSATGTTDQNGQASATLPLSAIAPGTYSGAISATFAGDDEVLAASGSATLIVARGLVTITWPAPADITYGTLLGGTQLNATADVPGSFVYDPPAGTVLTAGADHLLSVTFTPADSTNYALATETVSVNVVKATSSLVLASSVSPSTFGQGVAFTATINAASATSMLTGSVQFFDGTSAIGTGTVAVTSGTATASVTTGNLAVGTHTVRAVYAGNANVEGSESAAITQAVSQAATTVTLAVQPAATVFGQPVVLTATLGVAAPGAGIPSGAVVFLDGGVPIGTASLVVTGGVAVASLTPAVPFAVGTHALTAVYQGDGNFKTSASPAVGHVIDKAVTMALLSASPNPSGYAQPVTLSVLVRPLAPGAGTPTGTVLFLEGTTRLGSSTLTAAGDATLVVSLSSGSHDVRAQYEGDTSFLGAASNLVTQTVQAASGSTATTLESSQATSAVNTEVTFTATVKPLSGNPMPTGLVQFLDGGSPLGQPVRLATIKGAARAVLKTSELTVGTHAVTAVYNGDGTLAASTSNLLTHVVYSGGAPTTTTTTASSSPIPSQVDVPVSLTATVAAPKKATTAPSGAIQFYVDGMRYGDPVTLTSASKNTSTGTLTGIVLPLGTHTVQAVYSGDSTYAPSTSSVWYHIVQ